MSTATQRAKSVLKGIKLPEPRLDSAAREAGARQTER